MNKYTNEENEFLRNYFFEKSLKELSELFFDEFNKKISPNTLGKHCNKIGLRLTHSQIVERQIKGRVGACKKTYFSKEEDLWLKNNYSKHHSLELYSIFRSKFRKVSNQTLRRRVLFLGLSDKQHHYTEEQNEFLVKNVSRYTYPKLTEEFNLKFGTNQTITSIRGQCIQYLHAKRAENSFSASTLPLGSEVEKNGQIYVKVSETPFERAERWKAKSRIVYENEYGKIPEGYSIIFLDGNKKNCDIKNLYCVNNNVRACLAREKWYKKDGQITLTAVKCAELMCSLKGQEE